MNASTNSQIAINEPSPGSTASLPSRRFRIAIAVARGLALLLGTFALLNVLGELRNPGFDANLWWIDLRFADRTLNKALMIAAGIGLITFAIWPRFSPLRGWGLGLLLIVLMTAAAYNWWTFHRLVVAHVVQSHALFPLSSLVFGVLAFIAWGLLFRTRIGPSHLLDQGVMVLTVAASALLFPLAQMYCFGSTDYRRPADLIVVFGCLVHADGRPSMALADRVTTAVELYHAGFADRLLFSGGPGSGDVHETEAMRNLAMELGVPAEAIELDREGLNTQATVHNLIARYDGHGPKPRVLAVSNFYHLPRIKLCFRRSEWEVSTVPAVDSRRLYYLERYMLREVAALWWYYLNPN
ncbi:MAG TPA: YdcF family protein [Schlesneria sp.]